MKSKRDLRRGDAVEVERLCRDTAELKSWINDEVPASPLPITQWVPATVVQIEPGRSVAVAFSDGERMEIPWQSNHWRAAH